VLSVALPLAAWLAGTQAWTSPTGQSVSVSLVQGNIAQARKWDPGQRAPTLALYRELTLPEMGRDLVVWPESAYTFVVPEGVTAITVEAWGGGPGLVNSLAEIARRNNITVAYRARAMALIAGALRERADALDREHRHPKDLVARIQRWMDAAEGG